jgi:LacI family transcriptional regulator, repressor for deo operon, udp, cdd, tsx, nupC, and nupG
MFCTADEMAAGLMLAAQHVGLMVPGDLSVVGLDDHDLAAALSSSPSSVNPSPAWPPPARNT